MRMLSAIALVTASLVVSQATSAQEARNSLIGTITEAPDTPKIVGSQITFTGLAAKQVVMVWPDGYDTKLSKLFESPTLLVLQSVGTIGSTETVYIETRNKRFLVVSVGALAVPVGETVKLSQYRGSIR